jgi:hypothetical protein
MRPAERHIYFIQIAACLGLGLAYFLPFYQTYGLLGQVRSADPAWLFFWPVPVSILIAALPNRWLKALGWGLAFSGGLLTCGLLNFLASFKATPLVGFFLAQLALGVLLIGWLSLGVINLSQPQPPTQPSGLPAPTRKRLRSLLPGVFASLVLIALGLLAVWKIPVLRALSVKGTHQPEILVETFFQALLDDDLALAKELATPVAGQRLDEWKIKAQHSAVNCPRGGFLDGYFSRSRLEITYTVDNRAFVKSLEYACYYGDEASLSLWGLVLEKNGPEWRVTAWDEICTRPKKSVPETCYR